jgi:hypothetical protein
MKNQNLTYRFSSHTSQYNGHFFFYIRVFSEVKNKPLWIIIQSKKGEGKKTQKKKRNKQTKEINPTELLSSPVPSS